MSNKIEAYLKFAKLIAPEIFANKTPKFHYELLGLAMSENKFNAIAVFRGAGKSTLLNKIFIFSRVFFEKEPFTMIVSADAMKAASFLRDVKEMITRASNMGFDIKKGNVWGQNAAEVITGGKSCYILALGAGQDPRGYSFNFARPTLLISDDIESKEGQYAIANKNNRDKLKAWFNASLLPALDPNKQKVIIIGTILHDDSLLNNILNDNSSTWQKTRIPILQDGKSAWASRFSLEDINAIKENLERNGLISEFYQEYMCEPIAPERTLFKKEYLRYFERVIYDTKPISFKNNDHIKGGMISTYKASAVVHDGKEIPIENFTIYSTMDLASYNGKDKTAIVTFGVKQDDNKIFVLDVRCGQWNPNEKANEAMKVYLSFNALRFGMEKGSALNDMFYVMAQAAQYTGVRLPISELHHHSKAKNLRIANIHPLFMAGRVFLNQNCPSISELEAELLSFDPDVESKRDDIIDALAYMQEFISYRDFEPAVSVDEYESEYEEPAYY